MTREEKAYSFIDNQYASVAGTAALYVAGKLGIKSAKRAAKRRLINLGANKVLDESTKALARKHGFNKDKALITVNGTKKIAQDLGAPSLGKLIVKK